MREYRSSWLSQSPNLRWLFPAPAVVLVAVIIAYPIFYTVWMSLQDWFASSLTPPKLVGLANSLVPGIELHPLSLSYQATGQGETLGWNATATLVRNIPFPRRAGMVTDYS